MDDVEVKVVPHKDRPGFVKVSAYRPTADGTGRRCGVVVPDRPAAVRLARNAVAAEVRKWASGVRPTG